MLLDLVMVISKIPCNFPLFQNKRGSPSFAGVVSTKPNEVSFLNTGPFNSNASFKESQPTDTVLGVNGLEKAGHVGVRVRERLGALPFGEALDDPICDFFGGVN